jgi:hypothetical protein
MQREHGFNPAAVDRFGEKLAAWAKGLDPTSGAMLVDLLSKAGGDVRGADDTPDTDRMGDDPSSDQLSPLEIGDFASAVHGILIAATRANSTP